MTFAMGLRLHNTLTRTKEDFVPIDPANVRMYVCGPTVYDFAHIGNARPLIVFDVLFRLLRHLYKPEHVTYVRNITDVDDKIIVRAAEEFPDLPLNAAIREVTERTTKQFHEDVAALGCLPPTVEPRATEHVEEMKAMIEVLVAKGFAYVAADHVLFRVSAMADYGRLSNRTLDEMVAGARVEVAPYKQDPMDFVLWKPSKPAEPAWPSPAGIAAPGRPGWHIECSAMSEKWLWEDVKDRLSPEGHAHPHEFDIHGGGIDLVFPHHENEIAQSRCAHGTPLMARYWLHNGFLQVECEKMSKSLGNFVTIRELREGWHGRIWHGEEIRLTMLRTQYRQPTDWTISSLEESRRTLENWYLQIDSVEENNVDLDIADASLIHVLEDDLNTPLAISRLHEIYAECRGPSSGFEKIKLKRKLKASAQLLGFLNEQPKDFLTRKVRLAVASPKQISESIAARAAARKAKNFAEADRIRAELDAMGIALKDSKDPVTGELVTTWEVKR
jgi:cysteinyl-tRNA synthetase